MQIKDLEDWSKISKRKNKKKHQWGWFQNPNAGNVEYNIDFFNHVSGADGGDTSVLAGAIGDGGMGESVDSFNTENFTDSSNVGGDYMNDQVELYYDDLDVEAGFGGMDWDTGYPKHTYQTTVDYSLFLDRDDVIDDLWEILPTKKDELADEFNAITYDEEALAFIETNFDKLVDAYYYDLKDRHRDEAQEEAEEEFASNFDEDDYRYPERDYYDESINIPKLLNGIDKRTDNKYDLLNLYECGVWDKDQKKYIAEMLVKRASPKALYSYMNEDIDIGDDADWRIGLELYADNGKSYEVMTVLEEREVDGYDLAIVGALGNEASNAEEEVYFVLLDSDIEWGPVDTAEEAFEWASDVQDGYYDDLDDYDDYEEEWPDADDIDFIELYGAHGEYDDDYGIQKRHSMKEFISDDWSDTLETGGEPSYCPDCGVRFVRDEEGNAVCPECKRTPHQIEMDKRKNESLKGKDDAFGESLDEDTIKQGKHWVNKGKAGTHGKFATKKEADAQRKAMFANGYKESIKKACRRGNAMNEGAMKEIDLEIQEAGGVDAYIDSLESQLRDISREMRFLRGQARREMKAGGAYDSVDEINDALKATEREYNEVRKKYDYISSQQTGGVN